MGGQPERIKLVLNTNHTQPPPATPIQRGAKMASIDAVAQEIREIIEQLLTDNPELVEISSKATATQISGSVSTDGIDPNAMEGVDAETYQAALDQVLADYGIDSEARAGIYDQLEVADDYSPEGLMQHLTIVVSDTSVNTTIDNSIHNTGTVHGNIVQDNETNLSNATGEGAIAGRDQHGNFQTGDGQQVDGDNDGVMNQGDNSGQQAGGSTYADNVTTGDHNMVGSDNATVGHGNVSADGAYIDAEDSAVNLGGGTATYDSEYTDNSVSDDHSSVDSHADASTNIDIDGSGNSSSKVEDNDPVNTDIDINIGDDYDKYEEHYDKPEDSYDKPEDPYTPPAEDYDPSADYAETTYDATTRLLEDDGIKEVDPEDYEAQFIDEVLD